MKRVDPPESLERRTYFSPTSFSLPTAFATGTNPSDLVAAKLIPGGQTDVVTADFSSASISVLMGNGNGTFQSPVFYPVGSSPEALAVGDFNGDGIPDIVTANEADNTISVLLGLGNGTFGPQVVYPVGTLPEGIAVADLNGDGRPDIVTTSFQGSTGVSVLLNNGDGTFQPAVGYAGGFQPVGVALGDLNGDGHPDIVTANPYNNTVNVLLNKGDGTFGKPIAYDTGTFDKTVAIADITSNGKPDIITADQHEADISLLPGVGDGTFPTHTEYLAGSFPFAMAIADINGDGRLDVITADSYANTVGVQRWTGSDAFSPVKGFRAGTSPVAVIAADVNGDGRPDIITADFNHSEIDVLRNLTTFVPLVPTAITVTPNQNAVEFHNRLELTAQIVPTGVTAAVPSGVVQFFDGDADIGNALLSKNGTAHIFTAKLAVGSHDITADYIGDVTFAGSLSAAFTEMVVTADQVAPFVTPTIQAVHLASVYVPGDGGVVSLSINNTGNGPAIGTVAVQLYASTSGSFDDTAIALPMSGSGKVVVRLAGGRSLAVPIRFTTPASLFAGNYTIFAALSPVSGLSASQVSAVPAVGANADQAVLGFGNIGVHRGYKLKRTLANGTVVTLSMTGPGQGILTQDAGGGISVALSGTNGGSNLSITGAGITLDSLTDSTLLRSVSAPTTTLNGALNLSGDVLQVTLAGAINSSLVIGGGNPGKFSLGNVTGTSFATSSGLQSLAVSSYGNTPSDSIIAPWVGTITSAGDFGPALNIPGDVGGKQLSLQSVKIGGALTSSVWSMQFNVGAVQVGSVAAGWSGSVHGTIDSFIDTGDFAGELAAHSIGSMRIGGSLTNADILAGADFGGDGRLGNDDDFFGSGILTSLIVTGSVTNSVIAAGLAPLGTDLLGPGTTLQGKSAIRAIAISGLVDGESKFLSISLPAKVRINNGLVATAGDVNFEL